MQRSKKGFKSAFLATGETIKGYDSFGTPVTINYKGEDTYKSVFGGAMTILIFLVVLIQFTASASKMINRDDPNFVSYFLSEQRGPDEALNIPELGGQMYIGIRSFEEFQNGTVANRLIPFDESYINSKVAFYENGDLKTRVNLPACDDSDDFNRKVKYTSGLSEGDITNLKCIPADSFSLYNDAENNLFNQITLLFEQCGGKYASEVGSLSQTDFGVDSAAFSADFGAGLISESLSVFDDLFGQLASLDIGALSSPGGTGGAQGIDLSDPSSTGGIGFDFSDPSSTGGIDFDFSDPSSTGGSDFDFSDPSSTGGSDFDFSDPSSTGGSDFDFSDPSASDAEADFSQPTSTEDFNSNDENTGNTTTDTSSDPQDSSDVNIDIDISTDANEFDFSGTLDSEASTPSEADIADFGDIDIDQGDGFPSDSSGGDFDSSDFDSADFDSADFDFEESDTAEFGDAGFRALQGSSASVCKSEAVMRDYMQDKMIVVYVADSYVAQEDQTPNENELITYLTPIMTKRLDFRLSKTVNLLVKEINMEIQDSYWQIFGAEEQELEFTQTSISSEDTQSRLFFDFDGLVPSQKNTRDPIVSLNLKIDTTVTYQERTAFDSLELFGDIGGLNDFIYLIFAPIMGLLIGNRYHHSLFSHSYWLNNSGPTQDQEDAEAGDKTTRQKTWAQSTQEFKMSYGEAIRQNPIVRCFLCSRFQPKTRLERAIEIGEERTAKQLDVRSLMMTQNYVVTLTKLLLHPRAKRFLMKMQRQQRVLEPDADSDCGSSSDENNLGSSAQDEFRKYEKLQGLLSAIDYDVDGAQDMDSQVKELLKGVLRTSADDKKNREAQRIAEIAQNKAAFGIKSGQFRDKTYAEDSRAVNELTLNDQSHMGLQDVSEIDESNDFGYNDQRPPAIKSNAVAVLQTKASHTKNAQSNASLDSLKLESASMLTRNDGKSAGTKVHQFGEEYGTRQPSQEDDQVRLKRKPIIQQSGIEMANRKKTQDQ